MYAVFVPPALRVALGGAESLTFDGLEEMVLFRNEVFRLAHTVMVEFAVPGEPCEVVEADVEIAEAIDQALRKAGAVCPTCGFTLDDLDDNDQLYCGGCNDGTPHVDWLGE